MVKSSKGSAHLLLVVVIVLVGIIGVGYFLLKGRLTESRNGEISVASERKQALDVLDQVPIVDWETHTNKNPGFRIKYPGNFYLTKETEGDKEIVKISNHPDFESNEIALVITVEENINTNFKPTDDPRIFKVLENIGFSDLNTKFSNFLTGNFLGNPPWGYYQVVVPSQSPYSNSILITTRIHRIDELSTIEGGTEGKLAELTHDILSTFIFVDKQASEDISNWETYTNNKYYYEVKYPSNWTVKEKNSLSHDFVSFSPPETDVRDTAGVVGIMAEEGGTQVITDADALNRFNSFMDSCSQQTPTSCTQKTSDDYKLEKQITVDNRIAFQTYGGCCRDIGRHVFLYNDEYSYRITLYNLGPNIPGLKNEDEFELILSTFKFL